MRLRSHRKYGPLYPQLRSFSARTSAFPGNGHDLAGPSWTDFDPNRTNAVSNAVPYFSSSRSAFASFRSVVPKPSVNQSYEGGGEVVGFLALALELPLAGKGSTA